MQELIDIYDADEKPTGKVATYDEVRTKGLFRRGVHVIVYSPEGNIVMQRRSPRLDFHPGEIEISVGGGVQAGETTAQAAVRELDEEVGLKAHESDLVLIGRRKFNHSYRHAGQITYMRSFDYMYKLKVDDATLATLKNTDGEVSQIFIVSKRKLVWALRRHYLKGYGRFMPLYSYWAALIKAI